jgi:hypothetical protein
MRESVPRDEVLGAFVQQFNEAQNDIGLTPEYLAKALKRLIRAKKIDTFKGEKTSKKEVTDPEGNLSIEEIREDIVIYSVPMEDNATRRLALAMALNVRGVQTTSPTTQVNIDKPGSVNLMGYVAQVLGETDGSEIIEP